MPVTERPIDQLPEDWRQRRILFVTGRLAESALRGVLDELSDQFGLQHDVAVLGVSVAALLNANLVRRRLKVPEATGLIVLPGWCSGDIGQLQQDFGRDVVRGPRNLFDLPQMFGRAAKKPTPLDTYDIEILAEINHAPRWDEAEFLAEADRLATAGADVIDVGCIPGEPWQGVGKAVRRLREAGLRVSIDSFSQTEVEAAVEAGAELVLSCDRGNVGWTSQLGVEVVAIPETPADFDSLVETVDILTDRNVSFRIDPILVPIGCGFAASLGRYLQARRIWPDHPLMMGVGNLTELTEVDSAGINMLLVGFCQELQIGSVLTTEVINWCRSSVAEIDRSRRMTAYAVPRNAVPKHLNGGLVVLRDPFLQPMGEELLNELAGQLRDSNFRIFAERGEVHMMNRHGYWHSADPFVLMEQVLADSPVDDPSHAFYLGYEVSKAVTALTLGKNYTQDTALDWGHLTVEEVSHRCGRDQVELRGPDDSSKTDRGLASDKSGNGLDGGPVDE